MNNNDFQAVANQLLSGQNNAKINKVNSMLKTNEGRQMASELNRMANTNPNMQNIINSAKKGDLNSAAQTLSTMMNTQDGQQIASVLKKLLGE